MISKLISKLRSKVQTSSNTNFKYRGYKVYLGGGSSLLKQIRQNPRGIYEEDEMEILNKFMNDAPLHNIIDVGSNIGLFSLNLIKDFSPNIIYAFEPGPSQFKSFSLTIQKNNLANRIVLNNLALSNSEGTQMFSVHHEIDNSGDGFIDTGRAGEGSIIEVVTQTLDNYWQNMGNFSIDFIKIDTEGAELWVLQGAKKMIITCKPVLLIEIFYLNLKSYPHNSNDIFNFLEEVNYDLFNRELVKISRKELEEQHYIHGMFYAKPKIYL